MATTIHLNKVSKQPRINAVPAQEFYSKQLPVPKEVKDAILDITSKYELMEAWMKEAYDAFLPNRQEDVPEFPKELLHEEKQTPKRSKKGGSKERVRAGSSSDAGHSGGEV